MEQVIERCAGLDVHQRSVSACVRVPATAAGRHQEVRTFGTTTAELLALGDWLAAHGVTHVGMESTGVYWKPVYYLLEDRFTLLVVNAGHLKRVPGRKTDVSDCMWLAQLVEHGLVRPSFVPPREIRELRDLTRHRKALIQERTRAANRLHKILEDANIKLASVASDILGRSGRDMLQALVDGTTDAEVLAELARGTLRKKLPALRQALAGRFRAHHAFLVGQVLTHLEFLDEGIDQLSTRVEEVLRPFALIGERLTTIPGVKRRTAEVILAEIGADMSRFPTPAHLASWAGLCPGSQQSAGKQHSGKTRKGSKWLRATLVEAATAASHTKGTALSARYRRIMRHRGHKKAVIALARHILEVSYHLIRRTTTYQDLGPTYFDQRYADRVMRRCRRQLEDLGFHVTLTAQAA